MTRGIVKPVRSPLLRTTPVSGDQYIGRSPAQPEVDLNGLCPVREGWTVPEEVK